jgi:hypothetical protein
MNSIPGDSRDVPNTQTYGILKSIANMRLGGAA